LFGRTSWSERLENFRGIRCWSERRSGGRNSSSYTLHIIELEHSDRRKRIRLYQSYSKVDLRRIHEDYCQVLRLPAISDYGVEIDVRDVDELNKSVRALSDE